MRAVARDRSNIPSVTPIANATPNDETTMWTGACRPSLFANSSVIAQPDAKMPNTSKRNARIRAASPSVDRAIAMLNIHAKRGKLAGSAISKNVGCMRWEDWRLRGKVQVTASSQPVVALSALSISRYLVLLLVAAGSYSCLPSEPAPKGEKSKDNDLAFRPTDLSFKRPSAKPKGEAEDAAPRATAVHSIPPKDHPDSSTFTKVYEDHFDGPTLGSDWRPTSPVWRIENGRLCGQNAHNHPIWLQAKLPKNARISFTAASDSPDGDLKAEIWGDGRSEATAVSYTNATSYLFILGGWKNHFHVLARIDEHAADRLERRVNPDSTDVRDRPVVPGIKYKFTVERTDGRTVRWSVNGLEMAKLTDPMPLVGPGHEHLGFNDWEVHACFDDLSIVSLPD